METGTSLQKIYSAYPSQWLTLFRIALGVIILWKGFAFFNDSALVESLLKGGSIQLMSNNSQAIALLITYIILLGGFFIIVGLFTRWMCLAQIPIILGAMVFIYTKEGMSISNSELLLSVIVLLLLIFYVIKGSGVLSVDEYFRKYKKASTELGQSKK